MDERLKRKRRHETVYHKGFRRCRPSEDVQKLSGVDSCVLCDTYVSRATADRKSRYAGHTRLPCIVSTRRRRQTQLVCCWVSLLRPQLITQLACLGLGQQVNNILPLVRFRPSRRRKRLRRGARSPPRTLTDDSLPRLRGRALTTTTACSRATAAARTAAARPRTAPGQSSTCPKGTPAAGAAAARAARRPQPRPPFRASHWPRTAARRPPTRGRAARPSRPYTASAPCASGAGCTRHAAPCGATPPRTLHSPKWPPHGAGQPSP